MKSMKMAMGFVVLAVGYNVLPVDAPVWLDWTAAVFLLGIGSVILFRQLASGQETATEGDMPTSCLYCKSGDYGSSNSSSFFADLSMAEFNESLLPIAQRDLELIQDIVKKAPAQALSIAAKIQQGNAKEAFETAKEIGLTEDKFKKQGGGWPALLFVAVLALVVLSAPELDDPDPKPQPTWSPMGKPMQDFKLDSTPPKPDAWF